MTLQSLPVLVALAAACVGAVTDVWRFRVYNLLTIPLILTGFLYHTLMDGSRGLTVSVLGGLFGLAVLIFPYLLGLMGAGDVKLLAGVGAWLGVESTMIVFVVSSLVTGVYALGLMVYRGRLRESWLTIKVIFYRFAALGKYLGKDDIVESLDACKDRRLRLIPFGAMVPLGILGALLWFQWQS